MKATTYESAMNHWKNGYLAWNPKKYSYYRQNFYIGLSFSEFNPSFVSETGKAISFYYDTDHELKDGDVIYKDKGTFNSPEYNYYIKIPRKETLYNLTESDYNKIIVDFEQKIKLYMVKNRIDTITEDFE